MDVRELTVMIGTDQPEAMARFYGDILGLERLPRYRDPVYRAGGATLRLLRHAGVRGRSAQPQRLQLNLFVADVRAELQRLRARGVPVVRPPEAEWWGGTVATVEDPDGNYVQLLEEPPPNP